MSPTISGSNDPRLGAPRTQSLPTNGFDLLSSLVSPGSATPLQPETAWPGRQGWESPMQGSFIQGIPFPGQIQFNQPGFMQSMQQDFISLGDDEGDEDMYDPEAEPPFENIRVQQQQSNIKQAAPIAQSPLPATTPTAKKTATPSQVDSQKKAAELRAKLLANRPRSAASRRSITPSRSKELPIQSKSNTQEKGIEKQGNGNAAQPFAKNGDRSELETMISTGETGMNASIESLLAEGRNAANGKQPVQEEPTIAPKVEEVNATSQGPNTSSTSVKTNGETKQTTDASMSSDEEGEIRGDSSQPTSVNQPFESIESRQGTTTEAQEKIDRQVETRSAYGALKKEKPKTAKAPAQSSKEATKASEGSRAKPVSPKSARENLNPAHGRAAVYDSYKPGRDDPRRDSDQERRMSNNDSQAQQESIRRLKDLLSLRERELADLRRTREMTLQQPTTQGLTRNTRQAENGTADNAEAMPINDQDVADWLEMTEYYDEEYRQRRLSRFRRKRELDAARAELEREDQMDLEERTHRAQTAVSPPNHAFPPQVLRHASIAAIGTPSRMPPPAVPISLRESNNDRVGDISLIPQASTPTLKRQHAESDTDAQPAEKFVRTNNNNGSRTRGSSPSTGFKGEPVSARLPPPPPSLEDRMTRDSQFERQYPPRRRSFSPEYRYRRRSPSPHSRGSFSRASFAPERPYQNTCFKCKKPDHHQKDCPTSRRDSREEIPSVFREGPGGFPVSQNYKGKNPRPFAEVKNGGSSIG